MEIFASIVVLILSVVVHEVAHGYAADYLGDQTARRAGRLTLNPIPHLDLMGSIIVPALTWWGGGFIFGWAKPVPYNPYNLGGKRDEALVAAAGPASNLILAAVFALLVRADGVLLSLPEAFITISSGIVLINIILAIFNLIPIPPLDGSKILFALLPARFYEWRQKLERYGFFLVIIFVFFFWSLISPVIFWLQRLFLG